MMCAGAVTNSGMWFWILTSSVANTCLIGKDVDAIYIYILYTYYIIYKNIYIYIIYICQHPSTSLRSSFGPIWSPYALKCTHQCPFCSPDGAAGGVVHCLRGPAAVGGVAQGAPVVGYYTVLRPKLIGTIQLRVWSFNSMSNGFMLGSLNRFNGKSSHEASILQWLLKVPF